MGLHVVQDGLLVVEGAVSTGEGAALPKLDADARGLDDGARSGEQREGNGDQSGFAEHGGETDASWGNRREQESLTASVQLAVPLLKHPPCLEPCARSDRHAAGKSGVRRGMDGLLTFPGGRYSGD